MSKAERYNEGKSRLDLIDPHFEEALGFVLRFGAEKYGEFNWMKSCGTVDHESFVRGCIASLKRHTNALQSGQFYDEESRLPHTAHIAVNAMFIQYYREVYVREKPDTFRVTDAIGYAGEGSVGDVGSGEAITRTLTSGDKWTPIVQPRDMPRATEGSVVDEKTFNER